MQGDEGPTVRPIRPEVAAPVELGQTPRRRRVVDTDIELTVYGLEDADGTLGVSDQAIRDALHGMTVWVGGHHFILFLRSPHEGEAKGPDAFFWEDEVYHE